MSDAPKLIGREPTEEMLEASWEADLTDAPNDINAIRKQLFRAMWDAAPQVAVPVKTWEQRMEDGEWHQVQAMHKEIAELRALLATSPQPAQDAATADQCIELAGELEKVWAKNAVANTKAFGVRMHEGPFAYGWEAACDEIEARIGGGFPMGDESVQAAPATVQESLTVQAQPAQTLEILERCIADEKKTWTGDYRTAAYRALNDLLARFKSAQSQSSPDHCERCNKVHASVDCAPEDLAAAEARIRALEVVQEKPCTCGRASISWCLFNSCHKAAAQEGGKP